MSRSGTRGRAGQEGGARPTAERPLRERLLRFGAIALALLLVAAAGGAVAAGGATTQETSGTEPAFLVGLDAEGGADVTIRYTFDLSEETRAAAFESLEQNVTTRETLTATYGERMERVAAAVADRTEREPTVGTPSSSVRNQEGVGVVELTVGIDGLAAQSDGEVVLTEPFASGFSPDRPARVQLPADSTVVSVTPMPAEQSTTLVWTAGRDLDGFELVVSTEPASSGGLSTTTTIGLAVGAVVVVALLALALVRRD